MTSRPAVTVVGFLTAPGISGGSTVAGHVGDVEITAFDLGVTNTATTSGGGGSGTGKAELSPITIVKHTDAGDNVGAYAIKQGTVALSANYQLTFVGATLSITARPITVTAYPKTKVYGEADPPLTYKITVGNLVGTDQLTGSLTRDAGETVAASP